MTTAASASKWDLDPVLNLLGSFLGPRTIEPASITPSPPYVSTEHEETLPSRLGDLDVVLEYLSAPVNTKSDGIHGTPPEDSSSLYSSHSAYSTAASSPTEDEVQHFDDFVKTKEVRFSAEVDEQHQNTVNVTKHARRDWKAFDISELKRLLIPTEHTGGQISDVTLRSRAQPHKTSAKPHHPLHFKDRWDTELNSETDSGALTTHRKQGKATCGLWQPDHTTLPSVSYLTPAWVSPPPTRTLDVIPPNIPYIQIDRKRIKPLAVLTKEEKKAELVRKVIQKIGVEPGSLIVTDPVLAATQVAGNISGVGVHIFVDGSNIIIGFQDRLKKVRGMSKYTLTNRPPISYHSLALILERGRLVARRVLLGSADSSGLPKYMREAARCGYEISALERVEKVRDLSMSKRSGASGYVTSGQSSGSEAPTGLAKTTGEQGVDEILQMKMLESLVDYANPTTMVLASGDAAEAEYSGGFLKNVERALQKGWKVELVAWKDNIAYAWRAKDFVRKWKGRFRIIELDDFSEELLEEYVVPSFNG